MQTSLIPTFNGQSTQAPDAKPFYSPWLDYSTVTVPDNHELVMWWAQYLWLTDGNFRTAMERVAAHFITNLEFPDLEPGEESTWVDLFNNDIDIKRILMGCAYDYLAYGNIFASLYLPFKRFCRCKKCKIEQPIDRVAYALEFSAIKPNLRWHRTTPCPKCGSNSDYEVFDRRDPDLSRIAINRYDPSDIELAQNFFSQKKDFYLRLQEELKRDIRARARIHIDETPIEALEAVAVNGRLHFEGEMMFHQAEQTVSGVRTRGWGIPRTISNFRTAWLQQQTNKMDQAITIDYTLGIRMLSPEKSAGGVDPMATHGAERFVENMNKIVQTHRNNPTTYHTSPYPVNYQFLGGEGQNLLPPDKLKFRQQEYLNQLGVPLEYHQMNLSTQAAPMALRLFESYWHAIPAMYNRILDWMVSVLSRTYGLDATKVQMQKTTIADDMERKAVLLQLMAANQLSPETALAPFGVNAHEEVKKVMRHQEYVDKTQREQDEKMQSKEEMGVMKSMTAQKTPSMLAQEQAAMAQGGGAPMGPMAAGMPTGGLPGPQQAPSSLAEMSEQAQVLAEQLFSMDEYSRKQELKSLREGNKELHSLVMQNLSDIRSQARSTGGAMVQQQAAGGGGM